MKQHITLKQLNELSKKGKEAYLEWAEDFEVRNDMYINPRTVDSTFAGDPLLSIGQMIEFLDENVKRGRYWGLTRWFQDNPDKWEIRNPSSPHGYLRKELTDTLWQAVKEVLEK